MLQRNFFKKRSKPRGLLVVSRRMFKVAFRFVDLASVVVRGVIVRIEFDRPGVVGDGKVKVFHLQISVVSGAVCNDIAGIEFECTCCVS